ncbi:MAG: ribosome biogenesis/translation initiation ATPase RLI [Candidatus Syntrophoarchaeum sp.]|nr:ribosome biogenesis/translation initiation ATPase RLI [Candidatus Syntrophoarchaeum sp.]
MGKRIAVIKQDRCHPGQCSKECERFCPMVRTGDETITFDEKSGKAIISEILCEGCGICVKRCPFNAIMILGLPEELEGEATHRYGPNGFVLYGLPIPREGKVTGLLGPNGIGKSTVVKILSGEIRPNLGEGRAVSWDDVLKRYAGSELLDYFKNLQDGKIKSAAKPQYVDQIPKVFQGEVGRLLERTDEKGLMNEYTSILGIDKLLDRNIETLSGGELQRVAIAACISKDVDIYFLDELTPYLDIRQRINVTNLVQKLAEDSTVFVVEHDLAILDSMAEVIHIAYGVPSAYGVITPPKGVRVGINEYLRGQLTKENIRIRDKPIQFEIHLPRDDLGGSPFIEYGGFGVDYDGFTLDVDGGTLFEGEVMGIVGENSIGKSTFVKVLAGVIKPARGGINTDIKISYKPQYIKAEEDVSVRDFLGSLTADFNTGYYSSEILKPLQLEDILDSSLLSLSGGELQRTAIAATLSREADLYIFDEPSAHLDVEQRMLATKVMRRFVENKGLCAMVVDHDIYMIDLLSDRLLVFDGKPGEWGRARGPFGMREGMNRFLEMLKTTFRRDEGERPRINKLNSKLDREQKQRGEYYYVLEG